MKKEKILGIDVCVASKDDLLSAIKTDIRNNHQRFIVAINPEKILKAKKDDALAQLLNSADYQIPDGVGVVIASKLKKGRIKQRITGIDSMEMLCDVAAQESYKIFLYGGKPEVVKKAKEVLEQRYQNIKIAGYEHGYCDDNAYIIEQINKSGADIVFVAMGSPKQEYWITENKGQLSAKIFQGVGGSFDVICGNLKRAPKIMQKCGMEWLYRLFQQPKRIFRQIKMLKFLLLLMKDGRRKHED